MEELDRVKKILTGAPRGMTILDVSEKMDVNRNAVAKYLEMLRMSGEVEMKTFGRSKIFSLANRMPLTTALSLSSDLIALIDGNLRVIDANDQLVYFTGLSRSDIVGCPLDQINAEILTHPGITLHVRDALNGKECMQEIRFSHGKESFYFKVKLLPVATNNLQHMVAVICENITARKKAELALKESEARYRAVVEDQTEIICRMLPDTTLTFVNEAWCRYFQCTPENVLGKKHIDLMPPEYRRAFRHDLDSIRINRASATYEADIQLPGGRRWLQSTYRGRFDGKGHLTEIQIVARDITGRRQAEETLRKLSRVVEHSPAIVVIADRDGIIEYVNPKFTEITGYAMDEVIGRNPRFFKSGHTTQEEYKRLWDTVLSGQEWRGEFLNRKKNGELYWESAIISPITDHNGTITNLVAIEEDVTEKRQSESALRESEEKFRALFDQSPVGAAILSLDCQFLQVNRELCRILGNTEGELLSSRMPVAFNLGDPEQDIAATKDLIAGRLERYVSDAHYVCKDGNIRWLRKQMRLVRDISDKPSCFLYIVEDITDKKKLETSLEFTRFVTDNTIEGIIWMNSEGNIKYVNDIVCRMLKNSPEALMGMNIRDINPTLDELQRQWYLSEFRAKGFLHYETVYLANDGTRYTVEIFVNRIEYNGEEYNRACILDISGRKQAEHELKICQSAIDSAPGAICWADGSGRIVQVNTIFCRRTGYAREELLSRKVGDLCPLIDDTVWQWLWEQKYGPSLLKLETVGRTKSGALLSLEVTVSRVSFDDANYLGFMLLDITEHKPSEEILKKKLTPADLAECPNGKAA